MRRKPSFTVVGLVLIAVLASGCGSVRDPLAGSSATAVVVGSNPSSESKILAELYSQALTARGVPATTKLLDSRDAALRALRDGSIAATADHTGELLSSLDENASATTAEEVEQALPFVLPAGLSVLESSAAADQDVYVMTRALAARHRVSSLQDLGRVTGGVVLGAPAALTSQPYGPAGLTQIYGAKLAEVKIDESPAGRVKALREGRIQFATLRTTQAAIAAVDLVVLKDPQAMILPQNVVPVVRTEVAANQPAVAAIDSVQAALTTADLARLDQQVDRDQRAPGQVAASWLRSKGLV